MIARLDPALQPWMTAPGARAVVAALEAARPDLGPGGAARFVGGCVRDALIGRPVGDVDLATPLAPEAVVAALAAAGLKSVPTGLDHGTVTAVADHAPYEITTLRRDVATDGRNATVAFSSDWREDSARRDFRLNAIYASPDGTLFDPQDGVADALAGRVVFIGDPQERIREDYLRILRFFRFHAWHGRGTIDAAGLAACGALKDGIRRLSAERMWKELKKLLAAPAPAQALTAMRDSGVLEAALPEAAALELLEALLALEAAEGWEADPILRLAALVPRLSDMPERLKRRLKLSNAEAGRLAGWAHCPTNPRLLLGRDEATLGPALYALDGQGFLDRARLAWALDGAKGEADPALWRALVGFAQSWSRPVFPLGGEDLHAVGVPKGPRMGAALKALETLWARGGFRASKAELLAALPLLRAE